MDTKVTDLLNPAALLVFTAFVLPGFWAWKVGQLRLPHGEQKPQDVILEILGYAIGNAMVASLIGLSPTQWTAWPTDVRNILSLAAAVFLLPTAIAFVASWIVEWLASVNVFVSGHPTAWDRLVLSRLRREPFFILATLRDGRKLGGAFLNNGYASNYPYDRDLLIDQVWEVDQSTGEFLKLVTGEAGLYVRGEDILTVEIFAFEVVLAGVMPSPAQISP